MKTEKDVLSKFADEIAERISNRSISELQKIKDTLSGDDSELKNTWDEICAQVQSAQSFFWDVYDETARSIVVAYVAKLKQHERLALWFQTDEGGDWLYDDEDEKDEHPPVSDEDIVEYVIHEYVYREAGSWSNERIRAYLDRQ